MKVEVSIRRRPDLNERVIAIHNLVMESLRNIDVLWQDNEERLSAPLHYSDDSRDDTKCITAADLSTVLNSNFAGQITYTYRNPEAMVDKAVADDTLFLFFDTSEVNYQNFVKDVFPDFITLFSAYRATIILDEDLALDDYDAIVEVAENSEKDIDGRDTIYRINPINYFDNELCQRAFGLSSEAIVRGLESSVETISLIDGGVMIIVNSDPIPREEIEKIDGQIRELLKKCR